MAFPVSGPNGNAESVAEQIDGQVSSALAQTLQWRNSVNATGNVQSMEAESVYQSLLALRAYVQERKTVPGLEQAYLRRFPTLGSFDPSAEWNAALLAIDNFASWFQANWPERTASNKPAFTAFSVGTGELQQFTVTLGAAARAALVSRLDAVMAAFTTP